MKKEILLLLFGFSLRAYASDYYYEYGNKVEVTKFQEKRVSKSSVSEVLNRKIKLTIEVIRNLHMQLKILVESLFLDYRLKTLDD